MTLKWRPIETAPRDGTEIIVKDGVGGVHGANWINWHGTIGWHHHRNRGWIPSATYWIPMITEKEE